MESRLIHLVRLMQAKAVPNAPPAILLRPTTLAVPADRRLVVLGREPLVKSVFLGLLGGVEQPTHGEVVTQVRIAPVIRRGGLFHPRLTAAENVRFYARTLNLDAERLMMAVDEYSAIEPSEIRTPEEDYKLRKPREIALLTLLSFDCYLIDEIGHLTEAIRDRQLQAFSRQGAGVIFTTDVPQLARQYADCAIVINDGVLHPFSNVEEAISFNER